MRKLLWISMLLCISFSLFTLSNCNKKKKKNEEVVSTLTEDKTNYLQNAQTILQKFTSDPIRYFAEYGMVALTNQYDLMSDLGHDPNLAFQPMMQFFDQVLAQKGVDSQKFTPNFINKMQELGAVPIQAKWQHAIRFFARQMNTMRQANPNDAGLPQLYFTIGEGIRYGIKPQFFTSVSPVINPSNFNIVYYQDFCTCAMLFGAAKCINKVLDTSDNNKNNPKVLWRKVTEPFNTVCQGNCATLSTGLCLNKLGVINDETDGQTWYRISAEIKALTKGGAFNENINAYFEKLGFTATVVKDGGTSTALQQAHAALARGCDVKMVYNDGGKVFDKQHIEFVTHINVNGIDPAAGVVHTISWGDSANVLVKDGNFYGKSDGDKYTGEEFLAGKGNYYFMIYCKK